MSEQHTPDPQVSIRMATTAVGVPLLGHLLADSAEPGPYGLLTALCGERHKHWQPVTWFAKPEVFTDCERCTVAAVGEAELVEARAALARVRALCDEAEYVVLADNDPGLPPVLAVAVSDLRAALDGAP